MTEHMLKDLGGRKARKAAVRAKPKILQLMELEGAVEEVFKGSKNWWSRGRMAGWFRNALTISDEFEKGIAKIELTPDMIAQYVQHRISEEFVPLYVGALITELSSRNEAKGVETAIYIEGKGLFYEDIYLAASSYDSLIIDNFRGNLRERDATIGGTYAILNSRLDDAIFWARTTLDSLIIVNTTATGKKYTNSVRAERAYLYNTNIGIDKANIEEVVTNMPLKYDGRIRAPTDRELDLLKELETGTEQRKKEIMRELQ